MKLLNLCLKTFNMLNGQIKHVCIACLLIHIRYKVLQFLELSTYSGSSLPLCNAAGMSSAASLSADFARDGIFRNVQELLNRRHFESGLRKTELRLQGVEAMENVLIGGVGVFGALRRGSGKGDGIGMRMRTVPRLHSEAGMVAEHQIVTVIAATQRFLAVTREAQLRLQPRAPRDGEPRAIERVVVVMVGGGGGEVGEEAGGRAFLTE